jgi:sigma-B regulation protein RsbU (phosphoserine phosphatase)
MIEPSDVRVLVVEDDPIFQQILQKRLAAEGYQVLLASDGREGMRAIVAGEPHLVVSDWMMPEVDGLELCQAVKTGLGEAAPYFILLTARGEISDKLLGLQTGADDYLVKPCDHGELMARIRAGVRIVTLNQELRRRVAEMRTVLADREAPGGQAAGAGGVHLCRACGRVKGPDGVWEPPDVFLARAADQGGGNGTCPDCAAAGRDSLRDAA